MDFWDKDRPPNRYEAVKLLRWCGGHGYGITEWNALRTLFSSWRPELQEADLKAANLRVADLSGALLQSADVGDADLQSADLGGADLTGADLRGTDLTYAKLVGANFKGACLGFTILAGCDLRRVLKLQTVRHMAPSTVGTDTLIRSQGQIPDAFLRGCGLQDWEIVASKLYDPALTASDANDLVYRIFDARTRGPLIIGGVFISYAREDADFVNKLHARLAKNGVRVWLDRHDATAGRLTKILSDAIRLNDIVLIVLSKTSVESDWVEWEIRRAREKEKTEHRDIMCPIALDDAWKTKVGPIWDQVREYNVIDFSDTSDGAFAYRYKKLLKGLKTFYGPNEDGLASTE